MGDVGTALSNVAGGIGSALSGVGSAFSGSGQGGGGGGIGDAISSMFSGSAAPGQTTDPAQSFQQAVDPTGSVAASEAINPPGAAPSAASSQGQGGQQAQPPPKPAAQDDTGRQGALDEIRKLLTGQARGNPYQTGGGGTVSEGPIQDPLMPSPPLGAAGRIDTSGIPPRQPGSSLGLTPGEANEPPAETQGALARSPRAASAGQNAVSTATQPEGGVPAVQQPEIGPGSAAAAGGVPALASALARGSPLGAAAAVMQPTPAETGELPATAANIPPDQRNMPYPGQQYAADPSLVAANPPAVQQPSRPVTPTPGDRTPIGGGEGNKQESPTGRESDPAVAPLSKKQYEDVLKGQGVSASEAKKRADASTPADRARAAGAENLPTKKPSNEPYYQQGGGPGTSNITRDRAGMQGVPAMLGQLAQLAMPLIGMAMSGGLGGGGGRGRFHGRGFPWGRGGHGRFGGQWRGGHPGGHGSGMYPYHHPGMGWSGFGYHPGGGWRPLHPKYAASMGGQVGGFDGGGDGSGMDMSQLAPVLQALGINVPGMGGGQGGGFQGGGRFGGQGGSSGGGGASGGWRGGGGGTPQQGPWSSNPFLSTLVSAESGGRQGPNVRGDGGQAKGFFQFHDPTWQQYARNVPGASQYRSAEDAPPEVQQAVAMTAPIREWGGRTKQMLHARFGDFDERMTIGDLSRRFGGGGSSTPPGTAPVGDSKGPNPDGSPPVQRDFSGNPMTTAQQ